MSEATDPTAALLDTCTARTTVVSTCSTTEAHGARLRVAELAAACRARNIWLVLDVMQEAGVSGLDLAESGVDVAVAGGHKWLGCPFGVGFLYVSPARREELRPAHLGYLALEPPPAGWDTYFAAEPPPALAPRRAVRRLEPAGTPNFVGMRALAESLRVLNGVGRTAVVSAVRALVSELRACLTELGAAVVTPTGAEQHAGILTFTLGHRGTERQIVERLAADRIFVSHRYHGRVGGIRLSAHAYNTAADVAALHNALRRALA